MFGSGMAALIIPNDEINNIMKIFKTLEEYGLLIKGFNETIQNEAKEQKGRFLSMSLGTLGASLLGNLLTGQGVVRVGEGATATSQGQGTIRAGQDF